MASADEGEHPAQLPKRLDSERQRLAELRQRVQAATTHATNLKARMKRDRLNAAAQAEVVADQAEAFAAHLEATTAGQSRERNPKMAEREREIAALERRNAAKLRAAGAGPLHLETPPHRGLASPVRPGTDKAAARTPAAERTSRDGFSVDFGRWPLGRRLVLAARLIVLPI